MESEVRFFWWLFFYQLCLPNCCSSRQKDNSQTICGHQERPGVIVNQVDGRGSSTTRSSEHKAASSETVGPTNRAACAQQKAHARQPTASQFIKTITSLVSTFHPISTILPVTCAPPVRYVAEIPCLWYVQHRKKPATVTSLHSSPASTPFPCLGHKLQLRWHQQNSIHDGPEDSGLLGCKLASLTSHKHVIYLVSSECARMLLQRGCHDIGFRFHGKKERRSHPSWPVPLHLLVDSSKIQLVHRPTTSGKSTQVFTQLDRAKSLGLSTSHGTETGGVRRWVEVVLLVRSGMDCHMHTCRDA